MAETNEVTIIVGQRPAVGVPQEGAYRCRQVWPVSTVLADWPNWVDVYATWNGLNRVGLKSDHFDLPTSYLPTKVGMVDYQRLASQIGQMFPWLTEVVVHFMAPNLQ